MLRVSWFGHAGGRRGDGLTSYSARTVTALLERGASVQFFSHRLDGDMTPVSAPVQLRATRFKTVTIPLPGSRRRIARALRQFAPDVVHISFSFSLLDAWIVHTSHRLGAAVVATVHLPYAPLETMRGRVLYRLYRFHAGALRASDRCIALSEEQRRLLISIGCSPERVVVLPNGVDTDAFTPGPSRFRAEMQARFIVLYMGRLDPEKRVGALLRAFLNLGLPEDHLLVIAGSGSQEERLRALARGHPNVRLLGVISDSERALDVLRSADVFVLPSTAEALSLSLLEAMSVGAAVVATDVAESGAALADAGMRLPVRPLQPHLEAALHRLAEDDRLRHELGARARRRAQHHFSLATRIDDLLRLYEEVAAASPRAA